MKITGLAVAREIDKIVLIDITPMLTCRPDATCLLAAFRLQKTRITGTAPGLQQFARFVEHEHRWGRHTAAVNLSVGSRKSERADRIALRVRARSALHPAISGTDRSRSMVNPDVVVLINGNSADVAD